MSASDHLGPQFMSVEHLGTMQSADYPGQTMNDVHAMIRDKEGRDPALRFHMDQIREDIQERGLQHPVQVDRDRAEYGNGHHRYSAARDLGIRHLPVTHDVRQSTGPGDSW